MAQPTILRHGRYEVAAIKMHGDLHIGVREDPYHPWTLFGHILAVGTLALAVSTMGQKWATTNMWPQGLVIDSRVKGSDKPGDDIDPTLPRDILVGVGSVPNFRIPSLDDANDLAKVFQYLFDGTIDIDSLVPVDADLSEHSKGVNYGYAG